MFSRSGLAAVVVLSGSALVMAEKPFDFESTPGKLPKHVVPEEYAIRIQPDVKKLTFTGAESIRLKVRQPTRTLVLNAADVRIKAAFIDNKVVAKSAIRLDPKQETLTITAPAELAPGTHTLALSFSGKINHRGQGLYHAPYQEHGTAAKKDMLGTQFEATDARRMFPCWDEPSFRARFQLTTVVPQKWIAVSNMPIENERKVKGGKEIRFGMSPSMSSYLNVLCAGELDAVQKHSGNVLHRVTTTKGKAELGRYALASSEQIVDYYNDYFGTPFPLPKLDHIAVPGGFGGAMENWGGITYFESNLLFDPKQSSTSTKQAIYAVVAHEVAHQWFGNLVTMAWWDNLWLNEGFASWLGNKCTAKFNPDWEVWLAHGTPRDPTRRAGISKEAAMEGDARSTTHPIQQKVETEMEANSAFDDITYKKGEAFLCMLESFLGEEVFREGMRRYVARHKYSNTTTADLWNALSEASGRPVGEIAASWTEQPGFPVVKVARDASGKITLTQERFTINWPDAPPLEWKIPLTYTVAGSRPVSVLMTEKTMELSAPPDRAVKFNVEGAGNYRVQYDEASWKLLKAELPRLSMADRVNLLSDTWAFAQANRAPISVYLELVEKLPVRTEYAEQRQVIHAFSTMAGLLRETPAEDSFQQHARSVLRPVFDQVGWEARPNESMRMGLLRASLISALANFNDPEVIAGCNERFGRFLSEPASLLPDLRAPVFTAAARYADAKTWRRLHALALKTTSLEEKQQYTDALTHSRDPKLIKQTLAIALTNELPTSRAVYLVSKVARNSGRADLAWDFARVNMKKLLGKADALGAATYAPNLFTFFSDTARVEELKAYAQTKLPPEAAKQVEKAVDEVTFRADFKKRLAEQIASRPALSTPRD